ncbi:MAG: BrnA antitoxin family protein [Rhodobacteraceae bacterium]|nr:BrnA antitoxin family protein [Paracoccaceae bacterium]
MDHPRLTPAQRVHYRHYFDAMRQFEWDLRHAVFAERCIPAEWKALLEADRTPDKVRVTLRLDEDVVRFFRTHWGQGYQSRINTVLRAFLKLKMSHYASGPDSLDVLVRGAVRDGERPAFGDWEAFLAAIGRDGPGGADRPG